VRAEVPGTFLDGSWAGAADHPVCTIQAGAGTVHSGSTIHDPSSPSLRRVCAGSKDLRTYSPGLKPGVRRV